MGGDKESAVSASDGSPASVSQALRRLCRWPETWMFVLASIADIALTYVLIGRYGHYEANPIAAWFVYGWGLKGMLQFKAMLVLVVMSITTVITQTHVTVARNVVRIGAAGAAVVVTYSIALLLRAS